MDIKEEISHTVAIDSMCFVVKTVNKEHCNTYMQVKEGLFTYLSLKKQKEGNWATWSVYFPVEVRSTFWRDFQITMFDLKNRAPVDYYEVRSTNLTGYLPFTMLLKKHTV